MRQARPRWSRIARVRVRRLLSRWDRLAPAWLFWLPSWGSSILLHAVILVVLATIAYASNRKTAERVDFDSTILRLGDADVTSTVESLQAGDPFTNEHPDAPPSISFDPTDTSKAISQPSIAALSPAMTLPERIRTRGAPGLADVMMSPRVHTEDIKAPFSGRTGMTRAQLVRREGGTTESEKAVQDGLNWIMRHQREDGGWSLDTRQQCKDTPPCPEDVGAESDTAATGLALLPFLGAGHIHTEPSRYQETVRKGIDWLIAHQEKETGMLYLGGAGNSGMYSHAIAAMALCESYGLSKDPRLKQPARNAIGFIIMAQNKEDGGWRYTPGMAGDTSVFGWQMFALRSARLAGLEVPKNVLKGCAVYLDLAASDKHKTTYGYLPGRNATPVMTAEALLCRQYLGWPRDLPALVNGVNGVWTELQASEARNIYYWYYATQLLHNMQNKAWKQWNPRVRDALVRMQVQSKGCDHGSWSPFEPVPDVWGARAGGRLFTTSLSILTLEVYYRFLPLYRNNDPGGEVVPKI